MNALDANVLAYSVDGDGQEKRKRALALLQSLSPTDTVVPWQVVCELGAVLTRFAAQGRATSRPAAVITAVTTRFPLAMPPQNLALEGLRLRDAHQVSYWDALLIAACIDAGVSRLYSEDMQGKPVIEGVEIVNPFA